MSKPISKPHKFSRNLVLTEGTPVIRERWGILAICNMCDEGRFKLNVQTFALRLRLALKFKLVAFGQLEWIIKPESYSLIPNFECMSSKLSATPCSG
jgi:hypothetical protein